MNSRRTVSFQFSVGKETIKQISARKHKLGIELHKNFNRAKNTNWKLARIELGTFRPLQGW